MFVDTATPDDCAFDACGEPEQPMSAAMARRRRTVRGALMSGTAREDNSLRRETTRAPGLARSLRCCRSPRGDAEDRPPDVVRCRCRAWSPRENAPCDEENGWPRSR